MTDIIIIKKSKRLTISKIRLSMNDQLIIHSDKFHCFIKFADILLFKISDYFFLHTIITITAIAIGGNLLLSKVSKGNHVIEMFQGM